MKNIIVVIIISLFLSLSVQADPTNKIRDKMENQHQAEHKKDKAKKHHKKKIDITVKKKRKPKDKSVDWANTKRAPNIQEKKNAQKRNNSSGADKKLKEFHKWSNKTKDSIDSRIRKKDHNYQSLDPIFNERHQ